MTRARVAVLVDNDPRRDLAKVLDLDRDKLGELASRSRVDLYEEIADRMRLAGRVPPEIPQTLARLSEWLDPEPGQA